MQSHHAFTAGRPRWIAAGNEAEIQIAPGANHGFDLAPIKLARDARDRVHEFLKAHIR